MPPRRTTAVRRALALTFVLTFFPVSLLAGGGWVPEPGDGWSSLGWSRKTAHTSWDAQGDTIVNSGRFENHDFRYTYLNGEVGLFPRLSATYLVTYLEGLEGPTGDLHRNAGFSDAWFGLRYAMTRGEWPSALSLTVRTPIFYDIDGPYALELEDDDGNVRLSPEWRGLLKHDVTFRGSLSRSIVDGKGWATAEIGYTWREGAPADQLPLNLEAGWTLPWGGVQAKLYGLYVRSLGNDSEREPDDRFGSRPTFNFNDASMASVGASFLVPLGRETPWMLEAGYSIWVWGRSARQYEEPFFALGRRF